MPQGGARGQLSIRPGSEARHRGWRTPAGADVRKELMSGPELPPQGTLRPIGSTSPRRPDAPHRPIRRSSPRIFRAPGGEEFLQSGHLRADLLYLPRFCRFDIDLAQYASSIAQLGQQPADSDKLLLIGFQRIGERDDSIGGILCAMMIIDERAQARRS